MTIPLRFLTLALLAGSACGLTDCKKKSEPEPDKRSQREIWLTSAGWNIQSITQVQTTAAGVVTTYVVPLTAFDPCYLDDLNHFNADRTFTVDDGPLKCQPPVPSSTWKFASNETEIVFDAATTGSKITALTATNLALEETNAPSGGPTMVETRTYAAR